MRGSEAVRSTRGLRRHRHRRRVARGRFWLSLKLPLDYTDSVLVAFGNLVKTRGLSVGGFAGIYGPVEGMGDLPTQLDGVGAAPFSGGEGRQLAILDGELVDDLGGIDVGLVKIANQTQRAYEVGGEELGVVEEVVDGGLGVWIGGRLRRRVFWCSCVFSHVVASRVARRWRGARRARQALQPRVDDVEGEGERGLGVYGDRYGRTAMASALVELLRTREHEWLTALGASLGVRAASTDRQAHARRAPL